MLHVDVEGCTAAERVPDIGPTDRRFRSARLWRGLRGEPPPECQAGCPRATAPVAVRRLASTILPVNPRGIPVRACRSMPAGGKPNSYAAPATPRLRLA